MNTRIILSVLGSAIVVMGLAGCGSQQFGPASRELMKPLQTAISAKNPEWLDATEKKIEVEFEAGNVTDAEFEALAEIIEQSRSGDWKDAQQALARLVDGQRATSADIAQLNEGSSKQLYAEHRRQKKRSKG